MIDIKILNHADELKQFGIAYGFTEYLISCSNGRSSVSEFLKSKVEAGVIFLAVEESQIIGFAVVSDWESLPDSKRLEIIEVAKPFRGRGIGSLIMRRVTTEIDTMIILTASSSEPYYQAKLIDFYKNFGFEPISEGSASEVIMARIPKDSEKLDFWIKHIEDGFARYSYEDYQVTKVMPIWGRRYAPWLKSDFYIYKPLLERMRSYLGKS